MATRSAGLLLYRHADDEVELLLVHPGGPFWAKKDDGAWSIPKGEYGPDEDALAAALREFQEETGFAPPEGPRTELGEVRQPGGKLVCAWAVEGDVDVRCVRSNTFEMEWPRGSGRSRTFPEVDRAEWMTVPKARNKLLRGQLPLVEALVAALDPDAKPNTASPNQGD